MSTLRQKRITNDKQKLLKLETELAEILEEAQQIKGEIRFLKKRIFDAETKEKSEKKSEE